VAEHLAPDPERQPPADGARAEAVRRERGGVPGRAAPRRRVHPAALSLRYNRARQAKITTELCEIVAGAAALEG
jgi:hypothetical protein